MSVLRTAARRIENPAGAPTIPAAVQTARFNKLRRVSKPIGPSRLRFDQRSNSPIGLHSRRTVGRVILFAAAARSVTARGCMGSDMSVRGVAVGSRRTRCALPGCARVSGAGVSGGSGRSMSGAIAIRSSAVTGIPGMGGRGVRRVAMVYGGQLGAVRGGRALVLRLTGCRGSMVLMFRGSFRGIRLGVGSSGATVVTDAGIVIDHGLVIRIVDAAIDVADSPIVGESAVMPITPGIAHATVAESIVDAAIKTDVTAPIAGMPIVEAGVPTPITRGPQPADKRRTHPDSGDPVVALCSISPVTRRPNKASAGT